MSTTYSLTQLGWQHFFQQQLTLMEWESFTIARVFGVERSQIHAHSEYGEHHFPVTSATPPLVVGDWVLLDQEGGFQHLLDRASLFSRKAAGTKVARQLIASNIDHVFIVSSLNQDFNLNRIERYLALANEAGVNPVVVLTKLDQCTTPETYIEALNAMDAFLAVVTVNALDAESVAVLNEWCGGGKTVALLGSSGVGKSTLVNTLLGETIQGTQLIRADDSKGRHTTTHRSLHLLPSGGLLLDTPGMRELQLADCEQGVEETFVEIVELAQRCRFSDCTHESEPGCAVLAAIDAGTLEERRLISYQKLRREQAFNTATFAEKRAHDRALGRFYRTVMKEKQRDSGR